MTTIGIKEIFLTLFIIASALIAVSLNVPTVDATQYSSNVVANVIVSNTCFISASPLTPSFTALVPNSVDANTLEVTDTDNGGNAAATLYVDGADWQYGSNTIGVGNTVWATSSGGTGTPLTTSLVSTGINVPAPNTLVTSTSANVFFGLSIPAGVTPGPYTQTITLQNSCGGSTPQTTVTANVIVQGVCYIGLSTTSVNFGTLTPTTTYDTNSVITDTDNGGNAQASVLISGTDWTGPGSDTIPVANTLYSTTPESSYVGNALSNTLTATGLTIAAPTTTTPSTSGNLYLGMGVPAGTAGGTYTQNIIIENSC